MEKIVGFLDYRNSEEFENIQNFSLININGSALGFSKECKVEKFGYLSVIFKGEIYNKDEFVKKLKLYGYDFETKRDSEIFIKAVHKWGEEIVSKMDGDFKAAVLNNLENKFFLFRDKMGIMPLYYFEGNGFIIFADKLKYILDFPLFDKKLSNEALFLYFSFGYVLEPWSIWDKVKKVRAGSYLEFDLKRGIFKENRYFDIAYIYNMPPLDISEREAEERAEKLLIDSVVKRSKEADNIGVLLSGGYDSSILAALCSRYLNNPIYTITVGFEDSEYDESGYARRISKAIGTKHYEFIFSSKNLIDTISLFVKAYDEPFGDKASFGTIYALSLVRDEIDTVFGGDGGDEVFGTGDDIEKFRFLNRVPSSMRHKMAKTVSAFLPQDMVNKSFGNNIFTKMEKIQNMLKSENIAQMLKHKSQTLSFKEVNEILLKKLLFMPYSNFDQNLLSNANDELNQLLAVTIKTYLLDDEIVKSQRAADYFSLILKEPFLDENLLKFMGRIKADIKQKNGIKKYVLKEMTHKYIPRELMEREKHGFSFPLEKWLREDLFDLFTDMLSEDRLKRENILDAKKIIKMRDDFLDGRDEKIVTLWNIFAFELWYEEWMRG
ncbi:MAG: asparagine synthase (glutamine-hydrolyzing) [Epsilonproteobacteria bacterium]|nr:asparagine synthase (glutamine-hydrolyzing) [Campylobacterota bacterium]